MDRYVDTSKATNGTGTLASPWNNLLECFKGTTGYAPAAGDRVIIRGGLTVSVTASFSFSSTPTQSSPIYWVLDNGTFETGWTAIGDLTINVTGTTTITMPDFHYIDGNTELFKILQVSGTLKLKCNNNTFNFLYFSGIFDNTYLRKELTFTNSTFIFPTSTAYMFLNSYNSGTYTNATFIGCVFDLSAVDTNFGFLFGSQYSINLNITLIGCTILNTLSTHVALSMQGFRDSVSTPELSGISLINCATGLLSIVNNNSLLPINTDINKKSQYIKYTDNRNGHCEFVDSCWQHHISWLYGKNFPVLNSILPDDDMTPWSIKVIPKIASEERPIECEFILKNYNLVSAIRTLTLEVLTKEQSKSENAKLSSRYWWIEVSYIDATTNLPVFISTKNSNENELADSAASWTTKVWGANTYFPHKFVITTPTSIKKNTDITLRLMIADQVVNTTTDCFFIDPDFSVI